MTLSNFKWLDADQQNLQAVDSETGSISFPAIPGFPEYEEYLSSGAEAAPYVAPPEPAPETTEEKVRRLLSDYGLSRTELMGVLQATTADFGGNN